MAGFPRRWDEGPADGEDPSIGVPAASLSRVAIRHGERRCNRRKAGDLTFDPTTVADDPDADLFASRRRSGNGEASRTVRGGGAAVLGSGSVNGSRAGRDPAACDPAAPAPASALGASGDRADGGPADAAPTGAASTLAQSNGRAALAHVKPAVRRRNPLIALAGDPETTPPTGVESAAAPVTPMTGQAQAAPQPQKSAPSPAASSEGRGGWRSTFSRWRRKIALAADKPEDGAGAENPDTASGQTPAPSRNTTLYEYWTQLRRGRRMPGWSEIRVDEVARAWPNSFVVSFDSKGDAADGTAPLVRARRVTQDQPTGSDAEDLRLTDTVIEWILSTARAALKHGEPVQDRESFGMHDGKVVYAIVAVPFTGDRSGTEHILCHIRPLSRPGPPRTAGEARRPAP